MIQKSVSLECEPSSEHRQVALRRADFLAEVAEHDARLGELAARLMETDPAARFSALEMKLALLGN